ncbi:tail fiber assembly protein [Kosakonia pseudosacchari]|uniref:tail fiber assembly protein n=1 Tax=Kosakonia pseudosacchari TaxID=1646340 RepID=UPI000A3B87F2|nr:tail fiber assembly protein [Kosakonia pseudosacchari]
MTSAVLDKNKIATVAGNIVVYNFSSQTGEYTGSNVEYLPIGIGLPAYSTDTEPDVAYEGYVSVFNGVVWEQKEDHRGETVYSTADRSVSRVHYIGAIKEGFTTAAPSTQYDNWSGDEWVTDIAAQHAAAVAVAMGYQQQLIDNAMQSISVIQLKLQAARTLTDAEKSRLNKVLDYIDEITAIDTATAPDIDWPQLPV